MHEGLRPAVLIVRPAQSGPIAGATLTVAGTAEVPAGIKDV